MEDLRFYVELGTVSVSHKERMRNFPKLAVGSKMQRVNITKAANVSKYYNFPPLTAKEPEPFKNKLSELQQIRKLKTKYIFLFLNIILF